MTALTGSIVDLASVLLLVAGVVTVLLCCMGVLAVGRTHDKLHFLGPASTLAPVAVAAAVLLRDSFSAVGLKAVLVAVLLLCANTMLTHATARAAQIRAHAHRRQALDQDPDREEIP